MNTGMRHTFAKSLIKIEYSNLYIGGPEISLMSESEILAGLYHSEKAIDIVKNNDKFSCKIPYPKDFVNLIVMEDYWRDRQKIDYFIIDYLGESSIDDVNGFEFFGTIIDFVYLPSLKTSLGRQAFQNTNWYKTSYQPNVLKVGKNCYNSANNGPGITKLYNPRATEITSDPFRFANNLSSTKWYINKFWEDALINNSNAYINNFISKGGMVQIIQDEQNPPQTPQNVIINNITSNSFDISFDSSASINGIEDYEIFCIDEEYPPSIYFDQKRLLINNGTISGLQSGKEYKVKVRATDIYYNLSEFTNEITIITL